MTGEEIGGEGVNWVGQRNRQKPFLDLGAESWPQGIGHKSRHSSAKPGLCLSSSLDQALPSHR